MKALISILGVEQYPRPAELIPMAVSYTSIGGIAYYVPTILLFTGNGEYTWENKRHQYQDLGAAEGFATHDINYMAEFIPKSKCPSTGILYTMVDVVGSWLRKNGWTPHHAKPEVVWQ